MSVADYVVSSRCPCCGYRLAGNGRHWTPERIVAAFQAQAERDGQPPTLASWNHGTPEHPASSTARSIFGNWNGLRAAAGFPPQSGHRVAFWTKDRVAEAMLDELLRTGSWPRSDAWTKAAPGRPTRFRVYQIFGSWNAAKVYAGWSPQPKTKQPRSHALTGSATGANRKEG